MRGTSDACSNYRPPRQCAAAAHDGRHGDARPAIGYAARVYSFAPPGPGPLSTQIASSAEYRGSRPAARGGTGHQIQGHPRYRLWSGPARVGSGLPQEPAPAKAGGDDIDSTRMLI